VAGLGIVITFLLMGFSFCVGVAVHSKQDIKVKANEETVLKRKTLEEGSGQQDYRIIHAKYDSSSDEEKGPYSLL
jgi:hypothetical protein